MLPPPASELATPAPQVGSHLKRIDVLRAFAILTVFSQHYAIGVFGPIGYTWRHGWYCWDDHPSWAAWFLRCTLFNGHLGVCLFFVISGFCIRLSQFTHRTFTLGGFYRRRFWRIYPPYFAVLLTLTVIHLRDGRVGWGDFLAHALMVHNFSTRYFYTINSPFWSLAVEVQCYLLFPLLLLMHNRWGPVRTMLVLGALSAVSIIAGGRSFPLHEWWLCRIARQMPTCLWLTWYVGLLLADRIRTGERLPRRYLLGLPVLGGLFFCGLLFRPAMPLGEIFTALLLGLVVYGYVGNARPLTVPERAATFLGLCSYSFYLTFDPLIAPLLAVARAQLHPSTPLMLFREAYLPALGLMGLLAWGLYRVLELPSIELGKHIARQPTRPAN